MWLEAGQGREWLEDERSRPRQQGASLRYAQNQQLLTFEAVSVSPTGTTLKLSPITWLPTIAGDPGEESQPSKVLPGRATFPRPMAKPRTCLKTRQKGGKDMCPVALCTD